MKNPKQEIENNNPWYVNSHMDLYSTRPYKRVIEKRLEFIRDEIFSIVSNSIKKNKILDVGCGDGFYLQRLNDINNTKYFGLDYNILRIFRSKEDNKGILFINGNISHTAFRDNFFDIILLNHILEHIENDNDALKEMHRILKTEGIMILGTPNEGCLFARIRNKVLQRSILKETDHVNFYTENSLKLKLRSLGFEIMKIRREGFFCPLVQINEILASCRYGLKFLYFLGRIFKSQSAGLHFVCKKI